MWSSRFPDYKPFKSYGHSSTTNNEFNDLSIQDDRQIADQYPFMLH